MKGFLTGGVTFALLSLLATGPAAWGQYSGPNGTEPVSGGGAENADDRLDVPMNPAGRYDPTILKPEMAIGHPIGARFTPHFKLVRYFETISEQSHRARWRTYGTTTEGRPLGTLVVSSPENMAALATLQADLLRLADPSRTSGPEARDLAKRLPIVVWLSYNIHGDEASSSEAALATAYELVAGTGTDVTGLLDSLIVVIDPCLNPDGRDRYVNWVMTAMGREPNPGPDAWEHNQPWPGGRYNHYVFDLNRDWAWLTQVESRARQAEYRRWLPQVHVDFHEMHYTSSYFFFPAAEPFNTNLLPQVRYWGEIFGQANAAAFDERGWTYFTAEDFDLYYPGYGDSWPTLQGATGMTYEQAGHGRAGLRINRPDGTVLTLRERARHHFVASMATLRTARRERERRLVDFHAFFEDGVRSDLSGPAVYLFPPGADPGRTSDLMNLLIRHGAQVERSTEPLKTGEVRGYDGRVSRRAFPEGTFIVPMRQPMRALLNSLLEPEADIPETLFYDVAAWSLPLAFGVEAYWSDAEPRGPRETVTNAPPPAGGIVGPPDGVAWLLPWDTNAAPKVLNRLLRLGVRASFATRSFETEGRLFDRGTIVIPAGVNADTVGLVIDRVAREFHQPVVTARSGWTGTGIDLGSNRIVPIRAPRTAIVSGEGVDPTSFGALWFLLDDQYGVPITVIPLENLGSTNLSAYNVLIFPNDDSGHGHSYKAALDSLAVDRVRRWTRAGGVFIGLKGGAAWATVDRSGLTRVELKPEEDEEEKDDEDAEAREDEELARKLATIEEEERAERLKRIPGTILSVKLDPGHPLAYGYAGEAHILKTSDMIFQPSGNGRNVAYYTDSPRVSGYISRENEERLARTPFVIVEPLGSGRAVLYNDDPNFRVFWHGLNRLFLNSLFFSSGY